MVNKCYPSCMLWSSLGNTWLETNLCSKTDHNSLRYFLTQKDLNERQQKWVSKIQEFEFDIEYVKGKNNVVANALSRRPSISLMDVAINWKATLEVEYAKDKFSCKLFDGNKNDDRYKVLEGII